MTATISPTHSATTTARRASVSTPDGTFTVIADDADRVLASGWTENADYLIDLVHRSIRPIAVLHTESLGTVTDAVDAYYAGEPTQLDAIEVHQRSGPFLGRAWPVLRTVAPGKPVSYAQLAELAGTPTAIRGAAAACSRNAAALFVPCHRVLRSDGSLGGFRYGLPVKRSLLTREGYATA
ncbi:methylated-DNA--[protein]-cysteine S-methyltransferase [Gordonia aquimaris]|uniref:Methylated-DNA--[protein]-cysteine S-methyltransferase n=1 Tax=Gordonia aquimaris TaxID=2984863 RepID=A0A9X3DAB5_9ACTN|nr:methylated-DNA--[protein]-cysteine S-methyltransferase [Gordonia aquimaris]MCX2966517.1 methylated-DNA--[protein]-cysteine S-methyltransferase [Gordonia aquimaris]